MEDYEVNIANRMEDEESSTSYTKLSHLPLADANNIAVKCRIGLKRAMNEDDECDETEANQWRIKLEELVDRIKLQDRQDGNADDFHNLAVEYARGEFFSQTCDLLEIGLKRYPYNTDLLADYIIYGASCGRTDNCKLYFDRLMEIPKSRWTWRAFDFSIRYLNTILDQIGGTKEQLQVTKKEMLNLAKAYRAQFPSSEDSYQMEAQVYHWFGQSKDEYKVLTKAMENLNVCPKCCLRVGDILLEQGNYEDAMSAMKRGLGEASQTQSSVNEGYMYYVIGLCKLAISQKNNDTLTEAEALDIYSDFNIALRDLRDREIYCQVIETKCHIIKNKTGIDVPDECEYLCSRL